MTQLEIQLLAALKAQMQMRDMNRPTKLDEALTWRQNDYLADKMADDAIAEFERLDKAARHCAKCDRSEAACRCAVPELIEMEAKP